MSPYCACYRFALRNKIVERMTIKHKIIDTLDVVKCADAVELRKVDNGVADDSCKTRELIIFGRYDTERDIC